MWKYVEIKCQLDATDDFYCRSYCLFNMFRAPLCPSSGSGTIMPIIRSSRVLYKQLLPVVFGALVFKLSVRCGAEGYVSGLRAAAAAVRSAIKIICCIQLAFYSHIKNVNFSFCGITVTVLVRGWCCNYTKTKRVWFGHNVDKLRQQFETSPTSAFRGCEYDIPLFRTVMLYCYEGLQFSALGTYACFCFCGNWLVQLLIGVAVLTGLLIYQCYTLVQPVCTLCSKTDVFCFTEGLHQALLNTLAAGMVSYKTFVSCKRIL